MANTTGNARRGYVPPLIRKYEFPLKNGAYGVPRKKKRRIDPFILICIHITGNRNTASMPIGIGKRSGTRAEVRYMARDRHWGSRRPDTGNSAHSYIARDGSVLACIPTKFTAWNNGRLLEPNTKMKSVQRVVSLTGKGHNANEAYFREVECTGSPGRWALTKKQRETVSYLIARDAIKTGMRINRQTVHLHADLDSVNRRRCPFTESERWGTVNEQVKAIIDRAREIKQLLTDPPDDEDAPVDEVKVTELESLEERLAVAEGEIERLRRDRRRLRRLVRRFVDAAGDERAMAKIIDGVVSADEDGDGVVT